MHEHYHEALWVVAGTAAPVIGLALAVVVSDLLGKADPRSGCLIFTLYYACFAVALADFAAMIILLGFSMRSLWEGQDFIGPAAVIWLAAFGLFAVGMISDVLWIRHAASQPGQDTFGSRCPRG